MRYIPPLAKRSKGTNNSLSSSRSPAIVARNSSISHLCAFASDCAAFLAKSASEICGFGFDPEAVEAAGVSQVLSVAIASRSEVSNALSCSHAASGAPSGKRLTVANGGGCDHRKSDHFFLFHTQNRGERWRWRHTNSKSSGSELTALCQILRTALAASTTSPFNSLFSSLSPAHAFS